MADLPDRSVHLILADLPYGCTHNKWDSIIPLADMWQAFTRLLAPRGNIVLTAAQPFASQLIVSNPKWFHYDLVWQKPMPVGFLNAKRKPLPLS